MTTLSRVLWRSILAGLGFAAAIVVTLLIGTLGLTASATAPHAALDDPDILTVFVATMMRGSLLLPLFVTIVWPAWLAAIVLAEATATRSLLVHLVVATALAVGGVMGGAPAIGLVQLQVTAAIGLSAGFVDWLIAGRTAGIARPRPLVGAPRGPHDAAGESAISQKDARP